MDGRWPQRVEYCPGMRARHGVGHGVEAQTGRLGRRRACHPAGCHCAIVHSPPVTDLWPRARRQKACGYVDNATALPTSPQAAATTANPCLIVFERVELSPERHPLRPSDCAEAPSQRATAPNIRRSWQPFTTTLRQIADALNARGIPTAQGGQGHASSVRNVLECS